MNFPTPVILWDYFIGHYKDPSGQIIATSHDRFHPKWWRKVREIFLFQGNLGQLVKYYSIWPESLYINQPGFNRMSAVSGFVAKRWD